MTDQHITLGPQTQTFDNPYSTAFIEHVRGRIHREAEALPVYVYDLTRAEWEAKNLAKRIIVESLIVGFPNRLNDPVITNDWPDVTCMFNADRSIGWIKASWCPETDALRGGTPVDTIEFKVKAAPPNAAKRMIRGILGALKIGQKKTLADPEDNLAPVGTPDGRPPKTQQPRAESHKPAERVSVQAAPGQGAPRPRSQATPQSTPAVSRPSQQIRPQLAARPAETKPRPKP